MSKNGNPLIVIPARMQATRLPGKPLARIGSLPMIVHVLNRALESGVGPVIVACDGEEIADAVRAAGGTAILTDPNHPSGSDRIWEAVENFDSGERHNIIINLQGDVPTLQPHLLRDILEPLANPEVAIATLATEIKDPSEHTNPAVVKVVLALDKKIAQGRALYFSRGTVPYGEGPRYHHIGVYAYRREALQRFVSWKPSGLELREKLEQLRALEHGLRIDARLVDTVPLGVDTPDDLAKARELLKA